MIFEQTPIGGVFLITLEPIADERGSFARTFAAHEFEAHGLDARVVECNVSSNRRAGTLRGLHYQAEPHGEAKLVRCSRGAIFDVVVDLRPESPTYCAWFGADLSAANGVMLFVPAGLAHGFQTLADGSEVTYQMSAAYSPEHARGVRWNDPAFGIQWPAGGARTLSERDRTYPDFRR